jgi:hypothetical protein
VRAGKRKKNGSRKEKGKSRGHGAQVDDAFALSYSRCRETTTDGLNAASVKKTLLNT